MTIIILNLNLFDIFSGLSMSLIIGISFNTLSFLSRSNTISFGYLSSFSKASDSIYITINLQ